MKRIFYFSILIMLFAVLPAFGANVALYSDTSYIDYDPAFLDSGSEGSNLQAALELLGHTVTPFTGTSTAEWSAAIAGADVLVIPEIEIDCALAGDLDAGAVTAIQNFVNGGGPLLVIHDYCDFMNTIFGYTLTQVLNSGPWSITGSAAGTAFAGGPATLPENNATEDYTLTSLPIGSTCMYDNSAGTPGCVVFLIPQGSGTIGVLAYDWYNAVPIGIQDGGWQETLDRMMSELFAPAPASVVSVPTMNEWGMIIFMVFAGFGSALYLRRRSKV